jgi:hypothetical protein
VAFETNRCSVPFRLAENKSKSRPTGSVSGAVSSREYGFSGRSSRRWSSAISTAAIRAAGLEGEWQVVAQFSGFFRGLRSSRGRLVLALDAAEGGQDLLLKAGDQFAVGGH